jgi:large subunit ribosomal protein L35
VAKSKGPKLKTHKTTASRIKVTSTGKFMHLKQGSSHLRRKKSHSVKQAYGKLAPVKGRFQKRMRELLPHGPS